MNICFAKCLAQAENFKRMQKDFEEHVSRSHPFNQTFETNA